MKNIATPKSRLPTDVQHALSLIKGIAYAFDRVTIRLDHPAPDLPFSRISNQCGKPARFSTRTPKYHLHWQSAVLLFQPNQQALEILCDTVSGRHATQISYVETALDWITGNQYRSSEMMNYVLSHLYIKHFSEKVNSEMHPTIYFGPRAQKPRRKSDKNFVMYADKKSKLLSPDAENSYCCHLEYRLSGISACRDVGISTAQDCLRFNHFDFWRRNLQLFDYNKIDIGRALSENLNISDVALRKRADRFLSKHLCKGSLILQNCVNERKEIYNALRPVDNRHFLICAQ